MKRTVAFLMPLFTLAIIAVTLNSCQNTFAGTLMFLNSRDIVAYVVFALIFGVVAAVLGREARLNFWVCFLMSLILTPIAGLIYCLILLTRK
jgi:hypothetical protein